MKQRILIASQEVMGYGGEMYTVYAYPEGTSGVLTIRSSQINMADWLSQDPRERTCIYDPHWRGRISFEYGNRSLLLQENVVAGTYLIDQVLRAQRVEQQVTKIFREMRLGVPPEVPDSLREELRGLGGGLDSWQQGALEGDLNCVRNLRGKTCETTVPLPMRDIVIEKTRLGPGFEFFPLKIAEAIVQASNEAAGRQIHLAP